jgi:hypothetical protein
MTSTTLAPAPPVPRARRRLFAPLLGLWRIALLLLTVAVASQPVTMGLYLSGRYPMVGLHGALGSALAAIALLVAALSVLYALAGGRVWVVPVCVALFLACGFQIGMGYARNLALHLPLGVGILAGALLLTVWSWTRAASRVREPRRSA